MSDPSSQPATDDSGPTIHDLLNLPEDKRRVLTWMQRQRACSLKAISLFLAQTEEQAARLIHDLLQQGYLNRVLAGQEVLYQVKLTSMRRKRYSADLTILMDALLEED